MKFKLLVIKINNLNWIKYSVRRQHLKKMQCVTRHGNKTKQQASVQETNTTIIQQKGVHK